MASMAPAPGGAPMVPPKKKISPIVWIVIGIIGFFVVIGVALVAGGIFLATKIADNPALVAATAIAAANPDVEILSNDPSKGTVTFREKSSGKTITLNFDQIKEGRFVFNEDGKEVSVETGAGGLQIRSSDGATVNIGAGAGKLPEWIPGYPGATLQGTFASSGGAEESATVTFTTKDGPAKVLQFYEDGFKSGGMKVTNLMSGQGGASSGGMVSAESSDGKRQAAVTVSADAGEVNVGVTFSAKK